MKSFAHSVALITAFAVATRAIGFVFRIFLSRVLGAEMLGVYQIAMSFFMVFLTIIASGLPIAISKEIAKAKSTNNAQSTVAIVFAGLTISLIVSSVLCFLVFALQSFAGVIFTDERCISILLFLIPSVIACSIYTALRAVWWGEKKFFLLGATELFEQIVRVIFFVVLLALPFSFMDAAGIAGVSYTIACFVSAGVVAVIFIRGRRRNCSPSGEPNLARKVRRADARSSAYPTTAYTPLLKSAAPITGVRVIGSIALPIISIIIPMRLIAAGWTSSQAIAQYGIAVGMTMPLLTIPGTVISALATALVPELSSAHAQKDTASISRQISNALKFTLFITFLLIPAFIALGESIGLFLYDNTIAGTYLAQSAWIMIPLSLGQITNAILNSLGAEMKAMKHYIYGSIALFASVWFLPFTLGVNALIVGLGLCMSVASALNLILIARMTNTKSNIARQILTFALICIPCTLAGEYTFGIIKHLQPLFISLSVAGGITVALLLFLCKVFGIVDLSKFKLTSKKSTNNSIS